MLEQRCETVDSLPTTVGGVSSFIVDLCGSINCAISANSDLITTQSISPRTVNHKRPPLSSINKLKRWYICMITEDNPQSRHSRYKNVISWALLIRSQEEIFKLSTPTRRILIKRKWHLLLFQTSLNLSLCHLLTNWRIKLCLKSLWSIRDRWISFLMKILRLQLGQNSLLLLNFLSYWSRMMPINWLEIWLFSVTSLVKFSNFKLLDAQWWFSATKILISKLKRFSPQNWENSRENHQLPNSTPIQPSTPLNSVKKSAWLIRHNCTSPLSTDF